jgi:hypothetical protein
LRDKTEGNDDDEGRYPQKQIAGSGKVARDIKEMDIDCTG